MQIDTNDYLIIVDSKDKKYLVRCVATNPFRGALCNENFKTKPLIKYLEFEPVDVIANHGKSPRYGQSFGVTLEHIRYQFDDFDPWASLKIYRKHSDTEISLIKKSLERVVKNLDEHKIFPAEKPIEVHIKDLKGVMGGMYHHFQEKEGKDSKNDIIDLRIKDFGTVDYITYHEIGHGIWFQLMEPRTRGRWVKAFVKNISMLEDIETKIKKMRTELIKAETIRAYTGDLEESDRDIFNHVIEHIKKNYNVKPMHINILIDNDDDLTDVWPTEIIDIPQTNILVTEYATKDPEELWCEAFAHYMSPDRELSKTMTKLVEETISSVRYGSTPRIGHNSKGRKE